MRHTYEKGDIVYEGQSLWLMAERSNRSGLCAICLHTVGHGPIADFVGAHPPDGNMPILINIRTLVPTLLEIINESKKTS